VKYLTKYSIDAEEEEYARIYDRLLLSFKCILKASFDFDYSTSFSGKREEWLEINGYLGDSSPFYLPFLDIVKKSSSRLD
jgi:hypothetical protein